MKRHFPILLAVVLLSTGNLLAEMYRTKKEKAPTTTEEYTLNRPGYIPPKKKGETPFHFSLYFDLLFALQYRPGQGDLSFQNFHPFLMTEILPSSEAMFSFEVNPSPKFFEFSYQLDPRYQVRFGKIYLPFDDMHPHDTFGGRVNASRIRVGSAAFLPDLWTDLGLALKANVVDDVNLLADAYFFMTNGFLSGGNDPFGTPLDYPSFSDLPLIGDNNTDKAVGARLHLLWERRYGFGISYYTARWTDEARPYRRLHILGTDFQIAMGKLAFRSGYAKFFGDLLVGPLRRQGWYGELSRKLGDKDQWNLSFRGGFLDLDERLTNIDDQVILGAMLSYKPGLVLYALEHYQDIKQVRGKQSYSFSAVSVIIQL